MYVNISIKNVSAMKKKKEQGLHEATTSLPRNPGTDRLVVFKWFLLEPLGAIRLSFLQNSFFIYSVYWNLHIGSLERWFCYWKRAKKGRKMFVNKTHCWQPSWTLTVTDGPPQQVLRGKLAGRAGWNNVVMGHMNPTFRPKLQPGHRGCSWWCYPNFMK